MLLRKEIFESVILYSVQQITTCGKSANLLLGVPQLLQHVTAIVEWRLKRAWFTLKPITHSVFYFNQQIFKLLLKKRLNSLYLHAELCWTKSMLGSVSFNNVPHVWREKEIIKQFIIAPIIQQDTGLFNICQENKCRTMLSRQTVAMRNDQLTLHYGTCIV